jgi:hypothetical protein
MGCCRISKPAVARWPLACWPRNRQWPSWELVGSLDFARRRHRRGGRTGSETMHLKRRLVRTARAQQADPCEVGEGDAWLHRHAQAICALPPASPIPAAADPSEKPDATSRVLLRVSSAAESDRARGQLQFRETPSRMSVFQSWTRCPLLARDQLRADSLQTLQPQDRKARALILPGPVAKSFLGWLREFSRSLES